MCSFKSCPGNCQFIYNSQLHDFFITIIESLSVRLMSRNVRKIHCLKTSSQFRDFILKRLDTFFIVKRINNFRLVVDYYGVALKIFVEFRSHKFSPDFTFFSFYLCPLNKVKTLEELAKIKVGTHMASQKSVTQLGLPQVL